MQVEKLEIVALISGSGSTVNAIGEATLNPTPYGYLRRSHLGLVIASSEISKGKAVQRGIPEDLIEVVDPHDPSFGTEDDYGDALLTAVERRFGQEGADLAGQYGHDPHTPDNFVTVYHNRSVNQHGAPLDPGPYDFGGRGMSSAQRFHLARLTFVRETKRNYWTDVTAQRVAIRFDGGKVLKRGRVEILPNDTVDSLQARAIQKEWEVQIATIKDFEEGKVEELPPYGDLVRPGERMLLEVVKRLAQHAYPTEHPVRKWSKK